MSEKSICPILSVILFTVLSGVCAGDGFALKFDGTDDRVDVGTALISNDITMSAWVKTNTPWVNDARVVISNSYWGAAAGRVGFHLQYQSNGTAASRFQSEADGVGVWSVSSTTNAANGTWHHLAYVKQGTRLSVLVDGKEEGSRNDIPASVTGLTVQNQIRIGCNNSNARFVPGIIDEVCIWNYARTVAQIQESMNHELRGTEEGLVGYWKFNEGQGTTAFDSSPKPHNGTLVGGVAWTTDTPPVTPGPLPAAASGSSPANGAVDVPRDAVLSWRPGGFADKHDVYFGTVVADVNAASRTTPKSVLVSQAQDANTYDPVGVLDFGKTYYWRVDEVNAPPSSAIIKGNVWSFTTETLTSRITTITATASSSDTGSTPQNTVNNSGLTNNLHGTTDTTMWLSNKTGPQPTWIQYAFDQVYKLYEMRVWNYNVAFEPVLGFGFKDVTIECSVDGTNWTLLKETQFPRAPGQTNHAADITVDFAGAPAKFVRLTAKNNWGGLVPQFGLSEVQFYYTPVGPRQPVPASGATGVNENTKLSWRAGREAASHQVYFGTDKQAVVDGTAPAQTVADHSFDPGPLTFGKTYFWKVVEVNEAATPKTWQGDVWSFSTRESFVVEDFESYTDTEGSRIFDAWVDGWTNGTGSLVGNLVAPFAERTIVHGGKQAMPFEYNNVKTPYYSEAEREFSPVQNWTVNGADTLSLWVRGIPAAYVEEAGVVTMSAGGHDIWDNADDFRFASKSLTGNGSIVVKVESLVNTNAWAKAGVMIRQSLDANSKFAYMIVSYSSGVSFGWRQQTAGTCGSATQTGVAAPQWVKLTRTGDAFTAQYSADGKTWLDIKNTDGTVTTTTVAMTGPVYIGLCVTSHNAAATTTAVMSGAATTGNVTGSWQVLAIGDDPQPANSPGDLYVVVQDSSGKTATATNPTVVTTAAWTQWKIPLSSFTGVNLSKVKKVSVGVGNRANPTKGGAGKLYFDDFGFGHPLSAN